MNSLGGDSLKLMLSKILNVIFSFISIFFLVRYLTIEDYGIYTQLILIVSVFSALFFLGLPFSLNFFLGKSNSNEEREEFLSIFYTLSLLVSLLVGMIILVSLRYISGYFGNEKILNFGYFLFFYPWILFTINSVENVLIIYSKIKKLIFFRIINNLFILGSVVLLVIFELSFEQFILLFFLIQLSFACIVIIFIKRIAPSLKFRLKMKQVKKIFSFSAPIGFASVVGIINLELDKMMVGNFYGTEAMAIYTNASRELPLAILSASLIAVLLPRISNLISRDQIEISLKLWRASIKLSYVFLCLGVGAVLLFSKEIFILLYSTKYLDGLPIFNIYLFVLLLKVTYFGMILNAKGYTKLILYSSLLSLLLNIVLNYILLMNIGIEGAAYATCVSQFTINIIQIYFTSKILRESYLKFIPIKLILLTSLLNGFSYFLIKYSVNYISISLNLESQKLIITILFVFIWISLYSLLFYKKIKSYWNEINDGHPDKVNH